MFLLPAVQGSRQIRTANPEIVLTPFLTPAGGDAAWSSYPVFKGPANV